MYLPVIKKFLRKKEWIKYFITQPKQKHNWLLMARSHPHPFVYIAFL